MMMFLWTSSVLDSPMLKKMLIDHPAPGANGTFWHTYISHMFQGSYSDERRLVRWFRGSVKGKMDSPQKRCFTKLTQECEIAKKA